MLKFSTYSATIKARANPVILPGSIRSIDQPTNLHNLNDRANARKAQNRRKRVIKDANALVKDENALMKVENALMKDENVDAFLPKRVTSGAKFVAFREKCLAFTRKCETFTGKSGVKDGNHGVLKRALSSIVQIVRACRQVRSSREGRQTLFHREE